MKLVSFLLAPLVASTIVLTVVRIILIPFFLEMEYRTPGFPKDPYGFTLNQRLQSAKRTFRYLIKPEAKECLRCLKAPNGSPLYNEQELSHLEDVHKILTWALRWWQWALLFLLVMGIGAYFMRSNLFIQAVRMGAWLTLGLLGAIIFSIGICFNHLFDLFHSCLFLPQSWIFGESDSLIRLFPERFWIDCVLWLAAIAGAISVFILKKVR